MQLKSITINGFKSFADKTEIDFTEGIVAIVGPNGCGKSNIADAIRWVLGEQSAKNLRGSRMDDVIFSGSENRKPVNYAEVSLVLDNSAKRMKIDYSEVVVTRRLYRTGESEYLINKQPTRLKDISDLFVDTGLGKESFSIIGQGRIDDILSTKPEDRRGIFEEAAGIVKYKNRKKEAKRKLDDTEQNLLRIYDLITELEGQIEPLKHQSAQALEYKDYYNKLKELSIKIYVHDISNIYEKWKRAEEFKATFSEEQLDYSSELNVIDAAIEEKRWAVSKLDQELEGLHQQHLLASEKAEQEEGRRGVLYEREQNQASSQENLIKNINKAREKYEELNSETAANLQIKTEKANLIKEMESDLLEKEQYLSEFAKNKTLELEELKTKYFDLLNQTATSRNDSTHLNNQLNSLTYRKDKLKLEKTSRESELNKFTEEMQQFNNELVEVEARSKMISPQIKELELDRNNLEAEVQQIKEECVKTQNLLSAASSTQEILEEMQTAFSGYGHGAKEVLTLRTKETIKGIIGSVAELLTVPKEYELAIETALGNSLQHIVVDNEEIGRKTINYLKDNKSGRATLLPLNVIKGRRFSVKELASVKNLPGFIGLAIDQVELDSRYAEIGHYLLGRIVLATDLKNANQIAKNLNYKYKIVTKDGEVVNPGGSMTGGEITKQRGKLLGRQREIDELISTIDKHKSKLKEKEHRLEELNSLLVENERVYQEKLIIYNADKATIQQIQDGLIQTGYEKKRLVERIEYLNDDDQQISTEINTIKAKIIDIESNIASNKTLEAELMEEINQTNETLNQEEDAKGKLKETITSIMIELATHKEEYNHILKLNERHGTDLKEQQAIINELQKEADSIEKALFDHQSALTEILTVLDKYKNERDELQATINDKRKERLRFTTEIDQLVADSKGLRAKLRGAEDQLHQNEVKLGRLDTQLENLINQLTEEYEISFEAAQDKVEKVENVGQTRSEIQRLRSSLKQLGEINLGAIEEYERVNERYTFLTTQKADLIAAKESLYQIIAEADEEMTKIFSESFEAIREQFRIVFAKLFDGGVADLVLSDPDNILESGIEILAQPAGKKLKSIALLSGGERALTAISLLFAILQVKPVPFTILDEVDASLDDSNVIKFAQYLLEFTDTTQFIVITHRKGTMEGADALYGVTMQEAGVSKLVSVRLEERDQIEAV